VIERVDRERERDRVNRESEREGLKPAGQSFQLTPTLSLP
jgi:hypothetical protein